MLTSYRRVKCEWKKENTYENKENHYSGRCRRIDACDAVIDAWVMAMKGEETPDVGEMLEEWLKIYS